MNVIDWVIDGRRHGLDLQRRIHQLVTQADRQTDESWTVVNEARRARGAEPIEPPHPFRPRDLIDPLGRDDE